MLTLVLDAEMDEVLSQVSADLGMTRSEVAKVLLESSLVMTVDR